MTADNSPTSETTHPLETVDWTDERTAALRSFLEGHKFAMMHCDEEIRPPYGLCECMERLACWYVETAATPPPQAPETTADRDGTCTRVGEENIHTLRSMATFFRNFPSPPSGRPCWDARASLTDAAADAIERLAGEVRDLREALRQYANVNNWYGERGSEYVAGQYAEPGSLLTWDGPGADDGPEIARRALGEGSS